MGREEVQRVKQELADREAELARLMREMARENAVRTESDAGVCSCC